MIFRGKRGLVHDFLTSSQPTRQHSPHQPHHLPHGRSCVDPVHDEDRTCGLGPRVPFFFLLQLKFC